jgi:hypothetical protein
MALAACDLTKTEPSILLHPLDFLGRGDVVRLDGFPSMDVPRAQKLDILHECVEALSRKFSLCTVAEHSAHAARSTGLRTLSADIDVDAPLNQSGAAA